VPRIVKTGPEIDWIKAAIRQRMSMLHLTFDQTAEKADINRNTFRTMMLRNPSEQWSMKQLKAVCGALEMDCPALLETVDRLNSMDAEEDDGR